MTLIREQTVLIGDPIAVKILTHNPSLSSVSRYPVVFEFPRAEARHHQLTCHVHLPQEFSRASAACSISIYPHIRYCTYLVLLFNTTGEENKYKNNDVAPLVLCTITLHMVTSSSNHVFILREFFLSPVNPIYRSCSVLSFARHVFNMFLKGGGGGTLNSLNVRVSEIHEYMAQQNLVVVQTIQYLCPTLQSRDARCTRIQQLISSSSQKN